MILVEKTFAPSACEGANTIQTTELYSLLHSLGVTANYKGFFHVIFAMQLCIPQPDRLVLVTKWVYPDVARRYQTNWRTVERNIRTVRDVIWAQNRASLEKLVGQPLTRRPSAAQLLSILVGFYIENHPEFPAAQSIGAIDLNGGVQSRA